MRLRERAVVTVPKSFDQYKMMNEQFETLVEQMRFSEAIWYYHNVYRAQVQVSSAYIVWLVQKCNYRLSKLYGFSEGRAKRECRRHKPASTKNI
jgi:hypothetical protein